MAEAVIPTQFRVKEVLHKALKDEAHEKRISMNRMLVEILEERYLKEVSGWQP